MDHIIDELKKWNPQVVLYRQLYYDEYDSYGKNSMKDIELLNKVQEKLQIN